MMKLTYSSELTATSILPDLSALEKLVPEQLVTIKGEDFKLTTELSEKVQYSRNKAIKNGLNEAVLLM